MNQLDLFPLLPELSDEAAYTLSEFLHELALTSRVTTRPSSDATCTSSRHRKTRLQNLIGMTTERPSKPPKSRTVLGSDDPEGSAGHTAPSHLK